MPIVRRPLPSILAACLALVPLLSAAEDAQDAAERKVAGIVFTAYNRMLESKFALDIDSTDDQGNQAHASAEYESLARYHVKTDRMEIVTMPEGTWVRAGEAGWSTPPADLAAMVRQFVPKSAGELQASSHNLKDEGPTTWQGKPAHAYSYDTRLTVMGAEVVAHNKVVIDGDGRLVRSESDGESLGRKSHSVQDIRYDDTLRIEPPKA